MKKTGKMPTKRSDYVQRILNLIASGELQTEPGAVNHVHVYHDDSCAVFSGGTCNCDPEIKMEGKTNGKTTTLHSGPTPGAGG